MVAWQRQAFGFPVTTMLRSLRDIDKLSQAGRNNLTLSKREGIRGGSHRIRIARLEGANILRQKTAHGAVAEWLKAAVC
jgi:hypothetical protein